VSIYPYAIFTGLAFATLGAAATQAHADACGELKAKNKPPIPYVPFDIINPDTGQPYHEGDILTVNGTQMPYTQVYETVNNIERTFNEHGYSLRNATPEVIQELAVCETMMLNQGVILTLAMSNPGGPLSLDAVKDKVQKAIDQAKNGVPNWGEVFDKAKDENRDVYLPPVPTYTAPTPTPHRTPLNPLTKERAWSWEYGHKDSAWAQASANFSLNGNKTSAKAIAKGLVNGAVLGQWEGEVLSAEATAEVNDSHTVGLSINLRAAGRSVFSRSWNAGPIEEHGEKRFDVREEKSWRFAIGPIPCKGTVGFIGAAGLKYGFDVMPIQIYAFAVPFVSTKVFAQVGADIVIASAGVGGQLTLINDDVTLQGGVSVTFEDEPTITLEMTGKNKIDALSGRLYAFAKVGVWPLDKEWQFDLFKWDGYKKESEIFNYRRTLGPNGIKAEGLLTAEDVMEVTATDTEHRLIDLENASNARAFEVFNAIAGDLNGTGPTTVLSETARHASISSGIDETIQQYNADLNAGG
jgi:hypothetical protein